MQREERATGGVNRQGALKLLSRNRAFGLDLQSTPHTLEKRGTLGFEQPGLSCTQRSGRVTMPLLAFSFFGMQASSVIMIFVLRWWQENTFELSNDSYVRRSRSHLASSSARPAQILLYALVGITNAFFLVAMIWVVVRAYSCTASCADHETGRHHPHWLSRDPSRRHLSSLRCADEVLQYQSAGSYCMFLPTLKR